MLATADGMHTGNMTTIPPTYSNVEYTLSDFDFRHTGQMICSFCDGHVALTAQSATSSGPSLWMQANSSVTINGPKVTSWACFGNTSLVMNSQGLTSVNGVANATYPNIDYATMGGYTSIYCPCHSNWGFNFFTSTSVPAASTADFTMFEVFQLPNPPTFVLGGNTCTACSLFDMNTSGGGTCNMTDGVTISNTGSLSVYLNGTSVLSSGQMTAGQLLSRHVLEVQACAASGTTIWLDGTQLATNAAKVPAPSNRTSSAYYLGVGNNYNVNSFYLAELIYYPQTLASNQQNLTLTYLRNKYTI